MIVAAVSKPGERKVQAIQRLFIDTEDMVKEGAKMMGPTSGRGVDFYRERTSSESLVGEGIETTMSVMQVTGENGVAALTGINMEAIELPKKIKTIFILVDSDKAKTKNGKVNFRGQRAAVVRAKRFTEDGGRALFITPDDTCFTDEPTKLDFNDLLMADPTGASIMERVKKAIPSQDLDWEPPAEGKAEGKKKMDRKVLEMMLNRFIYMRNGNCVVDM